MMKKFVLVSVIAVMGLGAFLMSCSDDDDETPSSCSCIETGVGYNSGSVNIDPASFGAKNCSDLAIKLRAEALQSGYNHEFSCH